MSVRKHKGHKYKGKRCGKECEVKLGRKWTKVRAKVASDDILLNVFNMCLKYV